MLSARLPRDPRPNAWSQALAERRTSGARLLDLTEANPTRVGLPGVDDAALAALAEAATASYEPDPRGVAVAREAVAGYYGERGLAVHPDDVVLTSGTSEAYAHLFRLLADPGQTFLVPAPSYPLFEPLAALEGVRLRSYRLAWDGAWHLDLGSLEAATGPDVRGMIVVQPNHPTGSCLRREEVAAVERACQRCGAALISDEVFGDFPWPDAGGAVAGGSRGTAGGAGARSGARVGAAAGAEAPSDARTGTAGPGGARSGEPARAAAAPLPPSLLGPRRVPTFVLSGLSKVCGMPQLKLGWIVAAGPASARAEALRALEWIADLFLSVNAPVQGALPALLAGRPAWQARVRERLGVNLGRLRAALARRPELDLRSDAAGWVAALRLPARRNEEAWARELLRRDVALHPGHFYDFEEEPHLVASLLVPPAEFDAALGRLEDLLGED